MFTLKDIPDRQEIESLSLRYPDIDPSSVEALLTLFKVGTQLFQAGESYLAKMGISHGRFIVLMLLNRSPERSISPSELAERGGVTRATMTGLLDGLEKDGMIERESDPSDRRGILIHLTTKGHTFLNNLLPKHFQRVSALMSHLSEKEKQQLVSMLLKVVKGIPAFETI